MAQSKTSSEDKGTGKPEPKEFTFNVAELIKGYENTLISLGRK